MPGNGQPFASVQGLDRYRRHPGRRRGQLDVVDRTIGGSHGCGMGWFVGAAIGSEEGYTELDDHGKRAFEISARRWAGICRLSLRYLVRRRGADDGQFDIENIDGVFNIGSVEVRRESGDTEADGRDAADIGVNMMLARFMGRFLVLLRLITWYSMWMAMSRGTRSSAMSFGDLNANRPWQVPTCSQYPFTMAAWRWKSYGDAAYVEEFEDHTDNVEVVAKSLAAVPGSHARLRYRQRGRAVRSASMRNWNSGVRVGLSDRYADNDVEPNTSIFPPVMASEASFRRSATV